MAQASASRATGSQVPALTGPLPLPCQQDLVATRRAIRALASNGRVEGAASPADFENVLVIGANGFLGSYLVRDLLTMRPDLTVHGLVRASSPEHAYDRQVQSMRDKEIWDDAFSPRMQVHAGDISKPRLGLPASTFDELCDRVDGVYHFAADLSLAKGYQLLRDTNVLSLPNVLELCFARRRKHLFFASTMGVFPEYVCAFAEEYAESFIDDDAQPDVSAMKRLFPLGIFGYPWTKLIAEQCIHLAGALGLPIAILRIPSTSHASSGYTNLYSLTERFMEATADVKLLLHDMPTEGIVPADIISHLCAGITLNPERRHVTYHCCNPQPSFRRYHFQELGLDFPRVSYQKFRRACLERGDASPMALLWATYDHFEKYWTSTNHPRPRMPVSDQYLQEDYPGTIEWPGYLTLFWRCARWRRINSPFWSNLEFPKLSIESLMRRAHGYVNEYGLSFASAYPQWMLDGLRTQVEVFNAPESKVRNDHFPGLNLVFCRILRINAALAREWRRIPAIKEQVISKPVFIVGLHRTGTTYLQRLLSECSTFWSLRTFELIDPVMPNGEYERLANMSDDPRRAIARDYMEAVVLEDVFAQDHDLDLDYPEEDFPIVALSFRGWATPMRYHLPEFEDWLTEKGSYEAYAHHRTILQYHTFCRRLQETENQRRWLLKGPLHLMTLEELNAAYPDAIFVQTHRKPVEYMGSWCSLLTRWRDHSSEPQPPEELGMDQVRTRVEMLDRAMAFRERHLDMKDRWIDVDFYHLLRDPIGVVTRLVERCGLTLTPEDVQSMKTYIRQQDEHRRMTKRHKYDIADYGLTPEGLDAAFARHQDFMSDPARQAAMI